ncbi:bifunctional metallophosphatase/5'-nucleotidase [Siccirubricoccus sp. KC 17139]|uniref:Bifunctional metallophosphatase/5'-nucleotidase n=1 Tax=Siccirubricoccus soli TaxID=2899147 RepID=A0ABT1CY43_9PROT|nr:bifunctional UDP-sugar hydrolase/5'-nucleotidase [Siccirubricoccus soli]MCO6414579.1 bifunctional metallophosphatase/5'-nucleotidase [Siccirubricoccus soli]MCP2680709.1 bifunctional metallophosphatase/5'-nucleotidase [Siccirubricoccus soli]
MFLSARRLLLRAALLCLLALPAAAETTTLTFLHLNDIYEHLPRNGHGGLAEIGTLIERERAAAPGPVFLTFGGDLISPSLASSITEGAHMIEIFNALRTDVAVLGNHEFDFGPEVAARRIAESRFPWLGANVLGPNGQIFGGAVATVMRQAGPLRIGFVGVLTQATALVSSTPGITFLPELQAVREAAAALRAAGADLVVALTHLDLEQDREVQRSTGVDLVLGGHDHDPAALLEGGVLLLKSGSDAYWLGVAELTVETLPGRPARIAAIGWRMIPNTGVPPSAAIAPLVAAVETKLDAALGERLATLAAPLDSRSATLRSREAAIGDFFAEALRAHLSADVALINGGGLRGNREYPVGHVLTRRDLVAEAPFGNVVMLLEARGEELKRLLENGVSEVENVDGRFPQISGMAFTYDPRAPRGSRVQAVTVGGRPLEPDRTYRLATTDYLQSGKDGYDLMAQLPVLVDASGAMLLVTVVAEAAKRAGTIALVPDGRIRALAP